MLENASFLGVIKIGQSLQVQQAVVRTNISVQCISSMILIDWGNFLQKSAKNGVFRLETGQKRLFFEKSISLWLRHSLLTRASRALPCRGFPLAGSGRSRLRRTIAIPFLTNPGLVTDAIYCIRLSKSNTVYGFCFFCGFFLPLDCGEDRGAIAG